MKAVCTLSALPDHTWRLHHSSSALGEVAVTGSTREDAMRKMQNELQYRMELCPCTGESVGTVELQVHEDVRSGQD